MTHSVQRLLETPGHPYRCDSGHTGDGPVIGKNITGLCKIVLDILV